MEFELLQKIAARNRLLYQQKVTDKATVEQQLSTRFERYDSATGMMRLRDASGQVYYASPITNGVIGKGEAIRFRRGNNFSTCDAMPYMKQPAKPDKPKEPVPYFWTLVPFKFDLVKYNKLMQIRPFGGYNNEVIAVYKSEEEAGSKYIGVPIFGCHLMHSPYHTNHLIFGETPNEDLLEHKCENIDSGVRYIFNYTYRATEEYYDEILGGNFPYETEARTKWFWIEKRTKIHIKTRADFEFSNLGTIVGTAIGIDKIAKHIGSNDAGVEMFADYDYAFFGEKDIDLDIELERGLHLISYTFNLRGKGFEMHAIAELTTVD